MIVFAASGTARRFDYRAGDVAAHLGLSPDALTGLSAEERPIVGGR